MNIAALTIPCVLLASASAAAAAEDGRKVRITPNGCEPPTASPAENFDLTGR